MNASNLPGWIATIVLAAGLIFTLAALWRVKTNETWKNVADMQEKLADTYKEQLEQKGKKLEELGSKYDAATSENAGLREKIARLESLPDLSTILTTLNDIKNQYDKGVADTMLLIQKNEQRAQELHTEQMEILRTIAKEVIAASQMPDKLVERRSDV